MTEMSADGVLRDEQPLGYLSVGQTLRDEAGHRELRVGHGGPAPFGAPRRYQTSAHAQGPEPAAHPAGIPGCSRLGIQLQRPAEHLYGFICISSIDGSYSQILQRRGVCKRARPALVERDRFRKVIAAVVQQSFCVRRGRRDRIGSAD